MHVVGPAVKLYDSLGICVESLCVLQDWCPRDITGHLVLKLPITPNLSLFASKLLDIFLDLLAEKYFLQAYERAILKWQFFILEKLVKVGSKLRLLELEEGARLRR